MAPTLTYIELAGSALLPVRIFTARPALQAAAINLALYTPATAKEVELRIQPPSQLKLSPRAVKTLLEVMREPLLELLHRTPEEALLVDGANYTFTISQEGWEVRVVVPRKWLAEFRAWSRMRAAGVSQAWKIFGSGDEVLKKEVDWNAVAEVEVQQEDDGGDSEAPVHLDDSGESEDATGIKLKASGDVTYYAQEVLGKGIDLYVYKQGKYRRAGAERVGVE